MFKEMLARKPEFDFFLGSMIDWFDELEAEASRLKTPGKRAKSLTIVQLGTAVKWEELIRFADMIEETKRFGSVSVDGYECQGWIHLMATAWERCGTAANLDHADHVPSLAKPIETTYVEKRRLILANGPDILRPHPRFERVYNPEYASKAGFRLNSSGVLVPVEKTLNGMLVESRKFGDWLADRAYREDERAFREEMQAFTQGRVKSRGPDPDNDERNAWVYSQLASGIAPSALIELLKNHHQWTWISTPNGVKKAGDTYAKDNGLKRIRMNAGRPKKT